MHCIYTTNTDWSVKAGNSLAIILHCKIFVGPNIGFENRETPED